VEYGLWMPIAHASRWQHKHCAERKRKIWKNVGLFNAAAGVGVHFMMGRIEKDGLRILLVLLYSYTRGGHMVNEM
jgi:hypothetical protein